MAHTSGGRWSRSAPLVALLGTRLGQVTCGEFVSTLWIHIGVHALQKLSGVNIERRCDSDNGLNARADFTSLYLRDIRPRKFSEMSEVFEGAAACPPHLTDARAEIHRGLRVLCRHALSTSASHPRHQNVSDLVLFALCLCGNFCGVETTGYGDDSSFESRRLRSAWAQSSAFNSRGTTRTKP